MIREMDTKQSTGNLTQSGESSSNESSLVQQLQNLYFNDEEETRKEVLRILENNPSNEEYADADTIGNPNCVQYCICSYVHHTCCCFCPGKQGRIVQISVKDINPGDHIQWDRGPYHHHAIAVSINRSNDHGYVIHMSGTSLSNARVQLQYVNISNEIGTLEKANYLECNSKEIVLAKAYQMYLKYSSSSDEERQKYDFCNNNCEHFAVECKTENRQSTQVQKCFMYISCKFISLIFWCVLRGLVLFLLDAEFHDRHSFPCPARDKKIDLIPVYCCIGIETIVLLWYLSKIIYETCWLYRKELKIKYSTNSDVSEDLSHGCCDRYYCCLRKFCYGERLVCCRCKCGFIDFGRALDCVKLVSIFLHYILMTSFGLLCLFWRECSFISPVKDKSFKNSLVDEAVLASVYSVSLIIVEVCFILVPFLALVVAKICCSKR